MSAGVIRTSSRQSKWRGSITSESEVYDGLRQLRLIRRNGPYQRSSQVRRQMADVFTKAERSRVMARVRSSGNASTEIKAIRLFRESGITGWRRRAHVFGKPDFVFFKAKVAVFIDGCFWHGCPRCQRVPSSSVEFWSEKIQRNIRRDREVSRELRKRNWSVLRVRECAMKKPRRFIGQLRALIGTP